jgi:ADP-glucose pyrophosphorylase
VHIREDASVSNSVLWRGASVGAGATVDRCILGSGVAVPAGRHLSGEAIADEEQIATRAA